MSKLLFNGVIIHFNPWVGCSKVAPGCANCYAEADMDKRRHFAQWGPNGTRVKTSPANWQKPLKWNREAKAAGVRSRVFCSSLADVCEDWQRGVVNSRGLLLMKDPEGVMATLDHLRVDLFELIDNTPWLDWLLLTKRPENIQTMWPGWTRKSENWFFDPKEREQRGLTHVGPHASTVTVMNQCRKNVWLGTSVSDQATADKAIPDLLKCRDISPVLFLSVEPLSGPVEFSNVSGRSDALQQWGKIALSGIDWVIVGGESGPNSRPCNVEWIRDIVQQCKFAGVPCFVKQLGCKCDITGEEKHWPQDESMFGKYDESTDRWFATFADKKGGDPEEWPEDLRVREFPHV